LLILLFGFAGLFLIGKLADKGYHQFWRPFYTKLDVVFKDTSYYDVLFLGNSTVHFGINPYYVDSVTKLNTYNLGYGGADIAGMSLLLHGYMEGHPKPKAVLVSWDYSSFWHNGDFSNYFLYFDYLKNKDADNYLKAKGYRTWLVKIFPFLKYSYFDDYDRGNIITGFYGSPFEKDAVIYKGFLNKKNNGAGEIKMGMDEPAEIHTPDKKSVAVFYSLLDYCEQNEIKMLFVFPPRLYPDIKMRFVGTFTTDTMIQAAASRYHIPYTRYDEPGFFRPEEFSDNIHLNIKGSTRYSNILGEYVDSFLNKK
jgi:hypothetical protein